MAGNPTVHIGTCENPIAPDGSVHHCIVSLYRGVVSLQYGFAILHCGIVRLHRDIVNERKGVQVVNAKKVRQMSKKIRRLFMQKPAVCLCRFIPGSGGYNHW